MEDEWDMREGDDSVVEIMICGTIITAIVGFLFISSVGFLFFLDYFVLGNIIHWGLEVIWGLAVILYSVLFFRWSPNPTDWISIVFGHKIQWDCKLVPSSCPTTYMDEKSVNLDKEITKWVKEHVSSLMYARIEVDAYYFLKKSDYIAFKLRWI